MKKEWLLAAGSVALTLLIALGLIRWLAPTLLGLPPDLQMVRTAKELPPFYDGVFRDEHFRGSEFLLQDPVVGVRARPFLPESLGGGPHDALGFRNPYVPRAVHAVIIGDSQTYGNNALMTQNWPSHFAARFPGATIYNMSVGGWGAAQYAAMSEKVLHLLPEAVIVAFYSGNDPLETFKMAYNNPHWESLQTDVTLDADDVPPINFPAPPQEQWEVAFPDGTRTVFTAKLRHVSNMNHPVADAGWNGMLKVAREMADFYAKVGLKMYVTVIPTKELVYSAKVEAAGLDVPDDYRALVSDEARRIEWFRQQLEANVWLSYIDVVAPLQRAALQDVALYPPDANGHPVSAGYEVIGQAVADAVDPSIFAMHEGLVLYELAGAGRFHALARGNEIHPFANDDIATGNGWKIGPDVPVIRGLDAKRYVLHAVIDTVDPGRFGPAAFAPRGHAP